MEGMPWKQHHFANSYTAQLWSREKKNSATSLDENEEEECSHNTTIVSIRIQTNETDGFIAESDELAHESPQARQLVNTGSNNDVLTPLSQPTTPNSLPQHATEVHVSTTTVAQNSVHNAQTPKRKVRKLTSAVNSTLPPPHTPAEQYTYIQD